MSQIEGGDVLPCLNPPHRGAGRAGETRATAAGDRGVAAPRIPVVRPILLRVAPWTTAALPTTVAPFGTTNAALAARIGAASWTSAALATGSAAFAWANAAAVVPNAAIVHAGAAGVVGATLGTIECATVFHPGAGGSN